MTVIIELAVTPDTVKVLVSVVPTHVCLPLKIPKLFLVVAASVTSIAPPTFKFSAIPTPPSTTSAPVVELVEVVVLFRLVSPVTSRVVSRVTASSMFSVPFTVVAEPLAPRSTAPPPKVVLPVEVANILLALAAVAFVISPPFDIKSPVKVVTPVTSRVPPTFKAPDVFTTPVPLASKFKSTLVSSPES